MALAAINATINLFKSSLEALGYTWEAFTLNGRAYTRFTAPGGGSWVTRDANIGYPWLNSTCQQISSDKSLAYELCQQNGIHIPKSITIHDINTNRNELGGLLAQGPVVVKPSSASLSWGVTLNVRSREALEAAFIEAQGFSNTVVVQEQVYGEEVRFAVVNGVTKAALLRQTPRVIGDGKTTLEALVAAENEARANITGSQATYPMLDHKIIDFSHFDMQSVPAVDEVVELGPSTMIRGGASMFNIIDKIHPSYLKVAEKAAAVLGAPFIVVDMMIEDRSILNDGTNYAFIEFNSAPVLTLFYSCRSGEQYDVLKELVPMLDKILQGRTI